MPTELFRLIEVPHLSTERKYNIRRMTVKPRNNFYSYVVRRDRHKPAMSFCVSQLNVISGRFRFPRIEISCKCLRISYMEMLKIKYLNYKIFCYWKQLQQIFWLKVTEPFQQLVLLYNHNSKKILVSLVHKNNFDCFPCDCPSRLYEGTSQLRTHFDMRDHRITRTPNRFRGLQVSMLISCIPYVLGSVPGADIEYHNWLYYALQPLPPDKSWDIHAKRFPTSSPSPQLRHSPLSLLYTQSVRKEKVSEHTTNINLVTC